MAATVNGQKALVEQLIKTGISPNCTKGSISAFEAAVLHGHPQIAKCLLETGATATVGARGLSLAWRLPSVRLIKALVPDKFIEEPTNLPRDRGGRSYLENAILSGCLDVMRFALSRDATAYDSGALCAAVEWAVGGRVSSDTAMWLLQELHYRRSRAAGGRDLRLETVAISTASEPQASRHTQPVVS